MKNLFVCVKKKTLIYFFIAIFLVLIHFLCYFTCFEYKKVVKNVSENIFNGFSFGDKNTSEKENNIFFVFNLYEYINLGNKKPTLTLPSNEEYEIDNGEFSFKIDNNLIIKSAGSGIVKNIGFLENGLKYVEIRHSGGIVTRYENLKIVGVGLNYNVKNIHILGTCESSQTFIFKVYLNGEIIKNLEVVEGEIKWQN